MGHRLLLQVLLWNIIRVTSSWRVQIRIPMKSCFYISMRATPLSMQDDKCRRSEMKRRKTQNSVCPLLTCVLLEFSSFSFVREIGRPTDPPRLVRRDIRLVLNLARVTSTTDSKLIPISTYVTLKKLKNIK